jgi:hypothetical protein
MKSDFKSMEVVVYKGAANAMSRECRRVESKDRKLASPFSLTRVYNFCDESSKNGAAPANTVRFCVQEVLFIYGIVYNHKYHVFIARSEQHNVRGSHYS